MGEYATYHGEEVKIGTCESMYYLRADQRHLIRDYQFDGSERFRFPFPDEDSIEPGQFHDHDRGIRIPGWTLPEDWEGHSSVQFTASPGYVLSIPCPEQYGQPGLSVDLPDGLRVGRNGFHGYPVVKQQREIAGQLVTVVACGSCGAAWRLETIEDALPVVDAFRSEAERQEYRRDLNGWGPANSDAHRTFLNAMADRVEAGYSLVTA